MSVSKDLILASEIGPLGSHVRDRSREGVRLNINVLGEAVLGEREAGERIERVLEMMSRDEVNYVSVKLSSLDSQILAFDHEGSLEAVLPKLRVLYRAGVTNAVFVNLDMEEFRDLRLTMDAFRRVLSEPEFETLSAGIVLQAYLPEVHDAFRDLSEWALERHQRTGASIKIRLVKGANLAMEQAEAELHGWTAAPYGSKADVDASYARLVDLALRPENADAVRIGIASHNLFLTAWALDVARARGVLHQVDIEMLEGMANAEAFVMVNSGRPVLLYAPVTRRDDFAAAVAYLVRRLDENTSPDNYLRAAFFIANDETVFEEQYQRFLNSVAARHHVTTTSRRHQRPVPWTGRFENVRDGDPTEPHYVTRVMVALSDVLNRPVQQLSLVIDGVELMSREVEEGHDPSANGALWYRYSVATTAQIDEAVSVAKRASERWAKAGAGERRRTLEAAALVMEDRRPFSIGVMARDAGKTVGEADPEVSEAIDFARFYATCASDDDSSPLGVVLVVPPWNFPYAIPCGGVCAALAAGNAVIVKPAPETVATAFELVQNLWAGGVPRDVLQFVPTRDDDSGRRLVTHGDVDAVILTGAFETAQMFIQWKPSLNLLAETSGKNSMVITSFADIDLAVKDLVHSAFSHAGQKCSASSIAIVERSVMDNPAFLRQLVDAVESLSVGPGYGPGTVVGPIIRRAEPSLERALTTLDDGEFWLVTPQQLDDGGLLWRPGVKVGVRPASWSHQHEWFGPVLGIMTAPDFRTCVEWQNDVPYGLTAGLHSLDEEECQYWIDHVQAGNLYVNRGTTGAVVNRQPFGGWKRSSVGPTAKAGGANYVNCLRRWSELHDLAVASTEASQWWAEIGGAALDPSGLMVEENVQRYRHAYAPIVVRVDESFNELRASYVEFLVGLTGAKVSFSTPRELATIKDAIVESVEQLVARSSSYSKVRWLIQENPPTSALLDAGISTDVRPLAQRGDIEAPRWLSEQSVAVTRHRYGNVHAGPKPRVQGLAGH
jgi:RHH-type proline utilization regulon transcriptional repressor/proline dehydrogenase/delta 1-pyrroline-5-carboxylate dehydrogenase